MAVAKQVGVGVGERGAMRMVTRLAASLEAGAEPGEFRARLVAARRLRRQSHPTAR